MVQSYGLAHLLQCFTLVLALGYAASRDCKIDSTKDLLDPENVYPCPDDKSCCMEGNKPSCCGNPPLENEITDQTKIWGIVIGGTILIGILICCCRRDSDEGGKTCKYYVTCGCCRSKKHEDVEYQRFPPPSPPPTMHSGGQGMQNKITLHSVGQGDQNKITLHSVDQHVPPLPKGLEGVQKKMAAPSPDETKALATLQAEKLMEKLN